MRPPDTDNENGHKDRAGDGAGLLPISDRVIPPDVEDRHDLAVIACLTPQSDDSAILLPALRNSQIPCRIVDDVAALTDELDAGAGVLLMGDEAVDREAVNRLAGWFAAQPVWSALPVIVVTGGPGWDRHRIVAAMDGLGVRHSTLLRRPVNPEALMASVYTAVRSRETQYHTRDRLRLDAIGDVPDLLEGRLEELDTIYQTAPVGLCLLDRDLRYVRANRRLADMSGVALEDLIGRPLGEVVPAVAPGIEDDLRRILETGEPSLDREITGRTAAHGGEERTWLAQWYPLRGGDGRILGINVIAQDMTDSKRAREAMERTRALEHQLNTDLSALVARRTEVLEKQARELRELTLALSQAEQSERQRLSEALHGGLQQCLLAVRMQLQVCAEDRGENPPAELMTLLGDALNCTRSLSYELSPPLHPDATLAEELEWVRRWCRDYHNLEVELDVGEVGMRPPETPRLFLMQSLKELLANVVKHAGVRAARVGVRQDGDWLMLEVTDRGSGIGFAAIGDSDGYESGGFGLRTIRGRALALGGEFEIGPGAGGGTRVALAVPLHGGH